MDSAHRDRLAYVRVCSGVFERGMVVTHAGTKKPFATKYAQQVFGRERETVDVAYPGDVVGLVNASSLRVGDSLYVETPVAFPPIPSFAPEHFAVARAVDSGRFKQFRRGIEQLEQEGVVQVLRSDLRGDQAPVLAAVGPMQFEVAQHRMKGEMGAEITLDRLPYSLARRTSREWAPELDRQSGVEVLARSDGELLALFADTWRLGRTQRDLPDAVLEPLVAATE
jgi:peptide chain release factor 3